MITYTTKKYATTTVEDSSVGTKAWTDVNKAGVSDNQNATAKVESGEVTHYIKATGFGFDIGPDYEVVGIRVGIEHTNTADPVPQTRELAATLIKAGTVQTTTKTHSLQVTGSESGVERTDVLGDSLDVWEGSGFTATDVSDDDFGVAIKFTMTS